MFSDEGEEKRKKKEKKLVKHNDRKRYRKGKGMHSDMLPLYTIYNITCKRVYYLFIESKTAVIAIANCQRAIILPIRKHCAICLEMA